MSFSQSNAPHTIAGALKAADELLGQHGSWRLPRGEKLEVVLPQLTSELSELSEIMIFKAGLGLAGVKEVNKFLLDNKFTIQLAESGFVELAAASILDLQGRWPGKYNPKRIENHVLASGNIVPAIRLKGVKGYFMDNHNHPVISLQTEMDHDLGPIVFITRYEGELSDGASALFDLTSQWQREIAARPDYDKFLEVTIPMIHLHLSGDIEELLDGHTEDLIITQALFEHILKMNEAGFRARAAAVFAATRSLRPRTEPYAIDGPFIAWVETQSGINAFSAYVVEKDMRDPGNLDA